MFKLNKEGINQLQGLLQEIGTIRFTTFLSANQIPAHDRLYVARVTSRETAQLLIQILTNDVGPGKISAAYFPKDRMIEIKSAGAAIESTDTEKSEDDESPVSKLVKELRANNFIVEQCTRPNLGRAA